TKELPLIIRYSLFDIHYFWSHRSGTFQECAGSILRLVVSLRKLLSEANMRLWFLLAVAGFVLIGHASAGDQDTAKKQEANQMPPFVALLLKGGTDNFIKRFDKNKDGVLTKDECPPGLARIFDRFDINHDGKLDKQEIDRLHQAMQQRFGNNDSKKPMPPP